MYYDKEFKDRALCKLKRGISARQVARNMGVSEGTLAKWKRDSLTEPKTAQDETPSSEAVQAYVRKVEYERDILKKALMILIQSS